VECDLSAIISSSQLQVRRFQQLLSQQRSLSLNGLVLFFFFQQRAVLKRTKFHQKNIFKIITVYSVWQQCLLDSRNHNKILIQLDNKKR